MPAMSYEPRDDDADGLLKVTITVRARVWWRLQARALGERRELRRFAGEILERSVSRWKDPVEAA